MNEFGRKVVVLGCGPAGLLAAWAVFQSGHRPVILSKKMKSRQYGAQWIHEPIEGIHTEAEGERLEYQFLGDKATYAKKIYGDSNQDVSWGKFGNEQVAWNMRTTYNFLWDFFEDQIRHTKITHALLRGLIREDGMVDIPVISTIPKTAICVTPSLHPFYAREVLAGVTNRHTHPSEARDNVAVYNGTDDGEWYRSAWVFGKGTVEYPSVNGIDPPRGGDGLWSVMKPISNKCDCWSDRVFFTGRYGAWSKYQLSHDAYTNSMDYVQGIIA